MRNLRGSLTYGLLATLSLAPAIALAARAYFDMTQASSATPSKTHSPPARPINSLSAADLDQLARRPWFGSGEAKPWPANSVQGPLSEVFDRWRRLEARVDATQSLLLTDDEVPVLADDPDTPRNVVDELESIAEDLSGQGGGSGHALLPLVKARLRLWKAIASSRKTVADAQAAVDKGDYSLAAGFCHEQASLARPFRQHAAWPAFTSDEEKLARISRQAETAARLALQYRALADLPADRRGAALRELLANADPDLPAAARELLEQAVQELAGDCLASGSAGERLEHAEEALASFDTPRSRSEVQQLVRRYLADAIQPRPAPEASLIHPEWREAIADPKENAIASRSKNVKTIALGIYEPDISRPTVFRWWKSSEQKLKRARPTLVRTERKTNATKDVSRRIYGPPSVPFAMRSIGRYNEIAARTRQALTSAAAWRTMAAECAKLEHEAARYREMAGAPDGVFPLNCRQIYQRLSFAREASLAQTVVRMYQTSALILPDATDVAE